MWGLALPLSLGLPVGCSCSGPKNSCDTGKLTIPSAQFRFTWYVVAGEPWPSAYLPASSSSEYQLLNYHRISQLLYQALGWISVFCWLQAYFSLCAWVVTGLVLYSLSEENEKVSRQQLTKILGRQPKQQRRKFIGQFAERGPTANFTADLSAVY